MKRRTFLSRTIAFMVALLLMAGIFSVSTTVAWAASTDSSADSIQEKVQTYGVENYSGLLSDDSTLAGKAGYKSIQIQDGNVTKKYYYNEEDVDKINNKTRSLQGNSQIEALDNYYNLEADTANASSLMSGLMGPFRTFLGILVTCITVGMTIFTAFDLCYIAFPVFRGKMDDAKSNGTRGVTRTNSKGETKLNIVTDDAQYAVVAAETVQTGQSAFLIYFKKRIVSFVILAVLIFILLTGNINILTNIGVKLAQGVLDAINNSF